MAVLYYAEHNRKRKAYSRIFCSERYFFADIGGYMPCNTKGVREVETTFGLRAEV
jgi:hypothetical protein